MNPLDILKEKLKEKPKLLEREPVNILIKGEGEEIGGVEESLKKYQPPIIIDETSKGFDREELLRRMGKSGKLKVIVKGAAIEEIKKLKKKKVKKIITQRFNIEEEKVEEEEEKVAVEERVPIIVKPKKKRITEPLVKGVAVLGPETLVQIGNTPLRERVPVKPPSVILKVSDYYMNNRETFVNFINGIFKPYHDELLENDQEISCDTIGKTSSGFSLLTHQKIVRDYINLYTPYRGLLLYHGLGSGKTCTSIAIAEGMKDAKRVIVMTPASLRANYIEELKKCGDLLYKRNQYWEWIPLSEGTETLKTISAILNLPMETIRKQKGAFFINIKNPSNYDTLDDSQRKILEEQLNIMIHQKYTFINYNGLRPQKLSEMTKGFTENLFDNSVVIIDEAHNLISRIVNKIKKEKPIDSKEKKKRKKAKGEGEGEGEEEAEEKESIFGENIPRNLSLKLYYMLLRATNTRIVLLTGTPVINYPNEFAILFNILRGYIKTWEFPLDIKTTAKIDKSALENMLIREKTHDYLDYSPSSKLLTITRNPFGFKNKIKKDSGYQGVTNVEKDKDTRVERFIESDFTSDADFQKQIIRILNQNDIGINGEIVVTNKKALPDDLNTFLAKYINDTDKSLKNIDSIKRRIIGLSSYFRSAQENLLPKFNKIVGQDYHIIHIEMSDRQFQIYENARKEERKFESSSKKKPTGGAAELFEEKSSTYRIFSRLFCNFVMPDRPLPEKRKKKEEVEEGEGESGQIVDLLKEGSNLEGKQDVQDEELGEIEGDKILDNIGGTDYKERLELAIKNIEENSEEFLTPEALQTYSPKFLTMLEMIQREDNIGLNLIYSQFRTAEGIGLFSLVLEKNGFARFRINKTNEGWEINMKPEDEGKPTYALYTGTETSEEKEIIRHVYNGEWDQIPESISTVLRESYTDNNMGEVIKVFMITSSGSEGINLRNTRYVHIMEPYWHPVRSEQVIGRARRICSHKDLPEELQTVEVFVYLMEFSEKQLKSDEAIELKRKDLSKIQKVPITSDQYLFEISEIKANLTAQLTDTIKESAFDCYIYSNGKCYNFAEPTKEGFSYVPDYTQQQDDTTVRANKVTIGWEGKPIKIAGKEYVYKRINENLLEIYDKESYQNALSDPSVIPLKRGTLTTDEKGKKIVRWIE
jgi:hypothetical protein